MSRELPKWVVVLHGKWGGTRTVTVRARTAEAARNKARRERATISEWIGNAYPETIEL